jgi:CHASE2 domain-containing sensor protein
MIHSSILLRRALLADAIFSGVSALAMTLDANLFAPLLQLPEALLRETGLFLIAYTALVGWLGTRPAVPKALVMLVVAGNAAWTLASFALLLSGAVSPNVFGEIVVVAQAIATGIFAELQYIGMRRSAGVVAA